MRRRGWIFYVSGRWFSTRRASGGAAASVLAVAGLAIGVAALIVVLGVMNGFQFSYIDSILEVSSFHVRVSAERQGKADPAFREQLAGISGAASVLPFEETRCLITSRDGRSYPISLRALPSNAAALDPEMIQAMHFEDQGSRSGPKGEGIVLGAEIARFLDLKPGSQVDILSLSSDRETGIEAKTVRVSIDGTFRSGYYDFDFGMAVASFDSKAAKDLFPSENEHSFVYGIKLKDRYQDRAFAEKAINSLGLDPSRVESWRDYNRAFFGALRTEKTVMMILIGLIFLVVGVNIFHSMRRSVAEKTEDIAVLKSVGAGPAELRRIFLIDGLAIGSLGALIGLIVGLLIAVNVNEVFSLVESLVNFVAELWSRLRGSFIGEDFRIFSPQYFYLMEVPVKVLFPETLFVVTASIASSVAAAASAARSVSQLAPSEVLRYE